MRTVLRYTSSGGRPLIDKTVRPDSVPRRRVPAFYADLLDRLDWPKSRITKSPFGRIGTAPPAPAVQPVVARPEPFAPPPPPPPPAPPPPPRHRDDEAPARPPPPVQRDRDGDEQPRRQKPVAPEPPERSDESEPQPQPTPRPQPEPPEQPETSRRRRPRLRQRQAAVPPPEPARPPPETEREAPAATPRGDYRRMGYGRVATTAVNRLMTEFSLTREQAAGAVGNLAYESGGFRALQEAAPRAGRGGVGLAQWTGGRRVAFERFARRTGGSVSDLRTNLDFMVHELQTTHRATIPALRRQTTIAGAARSFERTFERAGVKAHARRLAHARRVFQASRRTGRQGRTYDD